jgi:general stress protein 26
MLTPDQIKAEAIRIVNQAFVGLLTTTDAQGVPHSRWMGSATAMDGLSHLYTLTSRDSRKLAQLQHNPNVCWVFTAAGHADVVTLYGQARILTSPLAVQGVWDRLMDCARVWCLSPMAADDELEVVTIETVVQRIELVSPRLRVFKAAEASFEL